MNKYIVKYSFLSDRESSPRYFLCEADSVKEAASIFAKQCYQTNMTDIEIFRKIKNLQVDFTNLKLEVK